MRSPSRHRIRWRSAGFMRGHGPESNAARAATTARSASSAPALATAQIGSSVAGFIVVYVSPEAASTGAPLMMSLAGFTGVNVWVIASSPSTARAAARAVVRRSLGSGSPPGFGSPALDDVGMMPVVLGHLAHQLAQRVLGRPHILRLGRNGIQRVPQVLVRALEQAQRGLPIQLLQPRHTRRVH